MECQLKHTVKKTLSSTEQLLSNITILIAEDDFSSYIYLKELFNNYPIKILYAENGLKVMEILEKEVGKYARQGWRIVSRTDTSAQMTRDKTASCLLALILAIFFVLPAILYLLLYRGSENLYLEVDERGKIIATR